MTQDEVIQWARDSGFVIGIKKWYGSIFNPHTDDEAPITNELEAFAVLVFEAGRQEGMKQERALWLLAETSKEIGEQL